MHLKMSDVVQMEARNCRCFWGDTNADTAEPEGNCEKLKPDSESTGSKTPTHYFFPNLFDPGKGRGRGAAPEGGLRVHGRRRERCDGACGTFSWDPDHDGKGSGDCPRP